MARRGSGRGSGDRARAAPATATAAPPDPEDLEVGTFGYVMAQVRASRLRAGATVAAVAVAVAFLVVVSSISVGLEGATDLELLDYTVGTPELPISNFDRTEEGDFIGLFAPLLLDMEEVGDVTLSAQRALGSASDVRVYPYSERELGRTPLGGLDYQVGRLLAVDPARGLSTPYTQYHDHLGLASGRHLSGIGEREVVLGYALWEERFSHASPGDLLDLSPEGATWYGAEASELRSRGYVEFTRLGSIEGLRLAGVLDRDLATDRNAYVPLGVLANETGAGWTQQGPRCEGVSVEVRREGEDLDALADTLRTSSPRITSWYVTRSEEDPSKALAESLRSSIYSWLVFAVAVILVAMVLGVANSTFLSVSQRTRELGTLRALGLTRHQVTRLVQFEALFLAGMGGVIGFFAGHITTSAVLGTLLEIEGLGLLLAPGRTVPLVVLGALTAVLVAAAVGSALPARRAAAQSPVEALASPL